MTMELAVSLVLFLGLVAGALDLGVLCWEKHLLTNASREGARSAVKAAAQNTPQYSDSQIRGIVQSYLDKFGLQDSSGSKIVLNNSNFSLTSASAPGIGTVLTVQLTNIPVKIMLIPNVRRMLAGNPGPLVVNLSTQTTMAREW